MRPEIPDTIYVQHRQIEAVVKIGKDHPIWEEFPALETPALNITKTIGMVTAVGTTSTIKQYALVAGSAAIYAAEFQVNAGTESKTRAFASTGINLPGAGVSSRGEDYRDLAVAEGQYYAALDGKVYYREAKGTWMVMGDFTTGGEIPRISLTALDWKRVVCAVSYSSEGVYDHTKLAVLDYYNANDVWKGYLPKGGRKLGLAAIEVGGTLYIYVDDWSGKKPMVIKRYAQGVWGSIREILPMDALDDDSSFTVGYASKIGDRYFLTGSLKRKFGPSYAIYMLGPEKFTFGRDLILMPETTDKYQLFDCGEYIVAGGNTDRWLVASAKRDIFTSNIEMDQFDPHSATISMAINQADRLTLDIPASQVLAFPEHFIPGSRIDLSVAVNSQAANYGRFGIDRIRRTITEAGDTYQVDCSSHGLKKLLDWESDTYFDYMGQSEVHGDPGDLTKLVRFAGGNFEQPTTGGLQLKSLNDDGMLYTTASASHGGFIHAKFMNLQNASTFCGVGLNYGEETLAEAAIRLNKKPEQVKASERGRWGLFAIYMPDRGAQNSPQVALADYNTIRTSDMGYPVCNPWRVIQYVPVARPAVNGTIHLAMQYQDGYARVYYTNSDTTNLTPALQAEAIYSKDFFKSEHENYGRGAIYLRNNTGFHMSYPFPSDSDVVPLYDNLLRYSKAGVPIDDRTDKFPASNGNILVDSERIIYTGIAGIGTGSSGSDRRVLQNLEWLPGKILAAAGDGVNTPAGTDTDFARTRGTRDVTPHVHGNNYLMQTIPDSARGNTVVAARFWLKKVNWPEDSVTLTINSGNVSNSANAIALVNNSLATGTMAPGSSLKEEGGWVTFHFNNFYLETDQSYWFVIRRNKNANHPNSTSYFQYKKMNDNTLPNAGCYVFCEEDDQAVGQGGDMAFVMYGLVEGPNKEYCIPVKYRANVGLPTSDATQAYWNGCAVVITEGPGKNNCYRVVRSYRWGDASNDLYLFFVDRNPGRIFDIGTMVKAVPALYGLRRGQAGYDGNPTAPSAHGDKSYVHLPTNTFALSPFFEYYTADEDLTVAEVAEAIARKAGVVETNMHNRHPSPVPGRQTNVPRSPQVFIPARSKNCIVFMQLPWMIEPNDFGVVHFLDKDYMPYISATFSTVTEQSALMAYIEFTIYNRVGNVLTPYSLMKVQFDWNIGAVVGDCRVSLYDGHLSAWLDGRLLAACSIENGVKTIKDTTGVTIPSREWAWTYIDLVMVTPEGREIKVMMPQAGTRVDNFVMDMGKTGAQLLTTLVGEKRIYYRDDVEGRLRIYTDREGFGRPYDRTVAAMEETTDIGVATRVLLEGGEIVEVSSPKVGLYGNFFKSFNISEINNMDDAKYFAKQILDDMDLNRERFEFEGAADPRMEPTDVIYFCTRLPDKNVVERTAVVDTITHTLRIDETDAVFDMRASGRYYPVRLPGEGEGQYL